MAEPSREEILARYRRVRAISEAHHTGALDLVSRQTLLDQARRVGLAVGKTLVAESMDELTLAIDLAIYTAPPDRTRAIDRYARLQTPTEGSDEALVLDAMRKDCFSLFRVERRHDRAGLILLDILREREIWLVDRAMERTASEAASFAMRIHRPDAFAISAGVIVPLNRLMMTAVLDKVLPLWESRRDRFAGDRRFATAIYRSAIELGVMERVRFEGLDSAAA
jgi:hypothetical protein